MARKSTAENQIAPWLRLANEARRSKSGVQFLLKCNPPHLHLETDRRLKSKLLPTSPVISIPISWLPTIFYWHHGSPCYHVVVTVPLEYRPENKRG